MNMSEQQAKATIECAGAAIRAERRRTRDMASAIEDFEAVPSDDAKAKAQAGMALLMDARQIVGRFDEAMMQSTVKLIEDGTGLKIDEMVSKLTEKLSEGDIDGAMADIGIAMNARTGEVEVIGRGPDGEIEVFKDEDAPPAEMPPEFEGIDFDSVAEEPKIRDDYDGGIRDADGNVE